MFCRSVKHLSISIILFALVAGSSQAAPVSFGFSGSIGFVDDQGGAIYSGTLVDNIFSGSFTYGSTDAEASVSDIGYWSFSGGAFGGSITNGSILTTSTNSDIYISDNLVMSATDAADLSALTGVSLSEGTIFDEWTIESYTDSNIGFGITFISLDNTIYNDLSYQLAPPELTSNYIALFFIQELDNTDNLIFESFGSIDSVSNVPLPPAIWLFAVGVTGLLTFSRRKKLPGSNSV